MLSPRLYSIFTHKCPRCLEGKMFPDPNPYHLSQTAVMHDHCPACNLNFQPEPGYYYGAMYVSYALTIAIGVAVFVAYYVLLGDITAASYLISLTVVLLLLAPWTFRTSRVIWLGFFQRFKPDVRAEVLAAHKAIKG